MTEPVSEPAGRCVCTDLVSVSERSALASGRWLGRGDQAGALEAAASAIRQALTPKRSALPARPIYSG